MVSSILQFSASVQKLCNHNMPSSETLCVREPVDTRDRTGKGTGSYMPASAVNVSRTHKALGQMHCCASPQGVGSADNTRPLPSASLKAKPSLIFPGAQSDSSSISSQAEMN